MIKQISTYGAVLLTAMIVIRATTLEEVKDVSSLYQRNADLNFMEDNLNLRDHYSTINFPSENYLAVNVRTIVEVPERKSAPISSANNAPISTPDHLAESETQFLELDSQEIDLLEENSEINAVENLSLDRESTINSGLSVIFNRERIHPRSSRLAQEE